MALVAGRSAVGPVFLQARGRLALLVWRWRREGISGSTVQWSGHGAAALTTSPLLEQTAIRLNFDGSRYQILRLWPCCRRRAMFCSSARGAQSGAVCESAGVAVDSARFIGPISAPVRRPPAKSAVIAGARQHPFPPAGQRQQLAVTLSWTAPRHSVSSWP